jgi:hypothetical protein
VIGPGNALGKLGRELMGGWPRWDWGGKSPGIKELLVRSPPIRSCGLTWWRRGNEGHYTFDVTRRV